MSGALRIALVADGRSPHTSRWANWFAEREHAVTVVWRPDQRSASFERDYLDGVVHASANVPAIGWGSAREATALRALGERLAPDIVHGLYLQQHGWTAHGLGRSPLVLSALGSDVVAHTMRLPRQLKPALVELARRRKTGRALRASAAVLCDSEPVAGVLRAAVREVDVHIVRFGVSAAPAGDARRRWRASLAIPQEDPVLLSSRLVKPLYNIDVILRALPLVLARHPRAVLVLKDYEPFGDPAYRRTCLDLIDRLGITAAVRLVGELASDDLLDLYAASDVFVSAPSTDATAVSVFEAMAARSAVVATDAPGIDPAVLRHEETALLVPVGSVEELARVIVRVLDDPGLRSRLVAGGSAVVSELADFDTELGRAERLYYELLVRSSDKP